MDRLKTGLLYVSLHNQLKKNAGVTKVLDRKLFFCITGKHFLIPKNLRVVVIKEMEKMGLIEIEDNGSIKVLDCDIDMETDVGKLYDMCDIY